MNSESDSERKTKYILENEIKNRIENEFDSRTNDTHESIF
jgi:hypothetical protein